jgi:hypothetical protein
MPFMVRYPFDVLRAVSQVEPLTTNGNSDTYGLYDPFALRFTCLRQVNPPVTAPGATRVSKHVLSLSKGVNGAFCECIKLVSCLGF